MKQVKFQKLTQLTVTWVDIVEDCAWRSLADVVTKTTALIKTPGFFICNKNDPERGRMLIMATSLSEDGDAGYICIPWGCIRKVDKNG